MLIFAAGLLVAMIACRGVRRVELCDNVVSSSRRESSRHVHADARSSHLRLGDRPLKVTSEVKPSRKPLFVAIKTKELNLNTRAVPINSTWLSDCSSEKDCMFFTSSGRKKAEMELNLQVVQIPEVGLESESPSHAATLAVLKYIATELVDLYDWFLVVSDNVYVRPKKLIEFLRQLDPMDKVYLGQPGLGNPEHRAELQLQPGEVFCMSGPGIVFSSSVVREAERVADKCLMDQTPSHHEAVELGRCFSRRMGIQCTWAYEVGDLVWHTALLLAMLFLFPVGETVSH